MVNGIEKINAFEKKLTFFYRLLHLIKITLFPINHYRNIYWCSHRKEMVSSHEKMLHVFLIGFVWQGDSVTTATTHFHSHLEKFTKVPFVLLPL